VHFGVFSGSNLPVFPGSPGVLSVSEILVVELDDESLTVEP
jgi:hypothetical protein